MTRVASLFKRNVKEIVREPISLVFLIVLPVAMEVLFYLMFHSLTPQFEIKYLAPAMVGFANAFLALFVAMLVSLDRETAVVERLYTTPVRAQEFFLAYLLAVIPIGLLQGALVLATACLLDASFLSVKLFAVLGISLLPILFYACIGIFLGCICPTKAVGGVASILITGQSVISGMWFPLEGLPENFVRFMDALPFRNISILLQGAAEGGAAITAEPKPLLILSAYTIVAALLAVLMFRIKAGKE